MSRSNIGGTNSTRWGLEEGRNSHSGAMTNLVRVTVNESQVPTQKATSGGCPVVDLSVSFAPQDSLPLLHFAHASCHLSASWLRQCRSCPESGPVFSLKREAESAPCPILGRTGMLPDGMVLTWVCLLIFITAGT